jgi:hypothetical protein
MQEYYDEFFANGICKKEPDACVWIGNQIRANRNYVKKQVRKKAPTDPYWHMVGLFYEQMEGVEKGKVNLLCFCEVNMLCFCKLATGVSVK